MSGPYVRENDSEWVASEPVRLAVAASDLLAALELCLGLIERDYSDAQSLALDGHPISRDARKEWDAGCAAVGKVRG